MSEPCALEDGEAEAGGEGQRPRRQHPWREPWPHVALGKSPPLCVSAFHRLLGTLTVRVPGDIKGI